MTIRFVALICLETALLWGNTWQEDLRAADRAHATGDTRAALAALESARRKAPDGLPMALTLTRLGSVQLEAGQFLAAKDNLSLSLDIWQAAAPADPGSAIAMAGLEVVYSRLGQWAKAERFGRMALQTNERTLGPQDPELAGPLQSLAAVLESEQRYGEAWQLYARALKVQGNGAENAVSAQIHSNLGMLLDEMHRPQEAIEEEQRAIAIWEKGEPQSQRLAVGLTNLATLYCRQRRWADAKEPIDRARVLVTAAYGPEHPMLDPILHTYAAVLKGLGQKREAGEMERAAAELHRRVTRESGVGSTVDVRGFR
jgi:tetratricopeptide (TPR) repeat protein